jgi:RimJ/RimL family protein N-acetyltransferase
MPLDVVTDADLFAIYETALANREAGREQPLVTVDRAKGRVIGSTRFMTIEPAHRRLEIGYTWLTPEWQKTAANSEAKLLMLTHAFEALGALRVEFKTDSTNDPSRNALLGIGAKFEGVFRRHMLVKDGRRRDSAYYSVTIDDWPNVRQHLQKRVDRLQPGNAPATGR